jgi:biotin-(acetyl-CoA carboxylase) ligase
VRVLGDCPSLLAAVVPAGGWSELHVDALPEEGHALWRALGTGDRLCSGAGVDPGPAGYWSCALVVAEAPVSQFDTLREWVAGGLRLYGPTACVALTGQGFHGQHGRAWLAAPGNLHVAVAIPEPGLAARDARSLAMLPAVALVDAVGAVSEGALRPGIKWVNDVLLGERKIGGALAATQIQSDRVQALFLGLGLNLATSPPVPSTPFVPAVGSLAEAGTSVTLADALTCVLAAVGERVCELVEEGPGSLLDAYRAASLVIGREVCVFEDRAAGAAPAASGPPPLRGTVRGIADDFSLILEGVETPVTSGRLAFAESCRRFGL